MRPRKKDRIKFLSGLTCFIFCFTSVTYAQPLPLSPEKEKPFAVQEKSLNLPEDLGTFASKEWKGKGSPLVIFIRDAHSVVDAQDHIRDLIQYFQEKYGIDLVALEGGTGKLDPTLFRTFPKEEVKKKVLRGYLERGELTGAEMSSIFSVKEMKYVGIETWPLYEGNYVAYLKTMRNEEKVKAKLGEIRKGLDEKRKIVYTEEMNEFHEKEEEFRNETLGLLEFLQYLKGLKGLQGKVVSGGELEKLFASIEKDNEMSGKDLGSEIKRAADGFKKAYGRELNKEEGMEWNGKYQGFVTGSLEGAVFLKYMEEVAKKKGWELELSSGMKALMGHAETMGTIRGTKLFEELEALVLTLEEEKTVGEGAKEIAKKYREVRLMEEMSVLEVDREQYEEYVNHRNEYRELMGELMDPAEDFYGYAVKRDEALHANMMKVMAKEKSKGVVVVLGGFHTKGFERKLKESGYSYGVVTPKMASLKGHEKYGEVMGGKVSYREYLRTTFYDAFVRASGMKLVSELNEPEMRRVLKHWRDEVLRRLGDEGRLAEAGEYTKYIDELTKVYMEKYGESALAGRTKEQILQEIEKELLKTKEETLKTQLKKVERQFQGLSRNLRGLLETKQFNAENVSRALKEMKNPVSPSVLAVPLGSLIRDLNSELIRTVILTGLYPGEKIESTDSGLVVSTMEQYVAALANVAARASASAELIETYSRTPEVKQLAKTIRQAAALAENKEVQPADLDAAEKAVAKEIASLEASRTSAFAAALLKELGWQLRADGLVVPEENKAQSLGADPGKIKKAVVDFLNQTRDPENNELYPDLGTGEIIKSEAIYRRIYHARSLSRFRGRLDELLQAADIASRTGKTTISKLDGRKVTLSEEIQRRTTTVDEVSSFKANVNLLFFRYNQGRIASEEAFDREIAGLQSQLDKLNAEKVRTKLTSWFEKLKSEGAISRIRARIRGEAGPEETQAPSVPGKERMKWGQSAAAWKKFAEKHKAELLSISPERSSSPLVIQDSGSPGAVRVIVRLPDGGPKFDILFLKDLDEGYLNFISGFTGLIEQGKTKEAERLLREFAEEIEKSLKAVPFKLDWNAWSNEDIWAEFVRQNQNRLKSMSPEGFDVPLEIKNTEVPNVLQVTFRSKQPGKPALETLIFKDSDEQFAAFAANFMVYVRAGKIQVVEDLLKQYVSILQSDDERFRAQLTPWATAFDLSVWDRFLKKNQKVLSSISPEGQSSPVILAPGTGKGIFRLKIQLRDPIAGSKKKEVETQVLSTQDLDYAGFLTTFVAQVRIGDLQEAEKTAAEFAEKLADGLKDLPMAETAGSLGQEISLEKLIGAIQTLDTANLSEEEARDLFGTVGGLKKLAEGFTGKAQRLDTLVFNQAGFTRQSVVELVSNAIDWTLAGKGMTPIGRFGIGAFQSLSLLEGPEDHVSWTSSTDGVTAYEIKIRRINGQFTIETKVITENVQKGTVVDIYKKDFDWSNYKDFLRQKFQLSTRVPIEMDGEIVNPLTGVSWINGTSGEALLKHFFSDQVKVGTTADGHFRVTDPGVGMSPKNMLTKLIIPRVSSNPLPPGSFDPEQMGKQTKIFYVLGPDRSPKEKHETHISLQVAGVEIEAVTLSGYNMPESFVIELPPTTDLTTERGVLSLDAQTRAAIVAVVKKILNKEGDKKEVLLNAIGALLRAWEGRGKEAEILIQEVQNEVRSWALQERKQSGNKKQFLPSQTFLNKTDLEEEGPQFADNAFSEILSPDPAQSVFIDDILLPFNPARDPSFRQVKNWSSERGYQVWTAPFAPGSQRVFFLHRGYIVLDERYYQEHKNDPALLHLLVNPFQDYVPQGVDVGQPRGKFIPLTVAEKISAGKAAVGKTEAGKAGGTVALEEEKEKDLTELETKADHLVSREMSAEKAKERVTRAYDVAFELISLLPFGKDLDLETLKNAPREVRGPPEFNQLVVFLSSYPNEEASLRGLVKRMADLLEKGVLDESDLSRYLLETVTTFGGGKYFKTAADRLDQSSREAENEEESSRAHFAQVYAPLAAVFSLAGRDAEADLFFERAVRAAKSNREDYNFINNSAMVAYELIKVNRIDQAVAMADDMNEGERNYFFSYLVSYVMEKGKFKLAMELMEKATLYENKFMEYSKIAAQLTAKGRTGEAEPLFKNAISQLEGLDLEKERPPQVGFYYLSVITNLMKAGRSAEAETLAEKFSVYANDLIAGEALDPWEKVDLLEDLAALKLRFNKREEAQGHFREAIKIIGSAENTTNYASQRTDAYTHIMDILIGAEFYSAAEKVGTFALAGPDDGANNYKKETVLRKFAEMYAEQGDVEKALSAARRIERSDASREGVLLSVASILAEKKKFKESIAIFDGLGSIEAEEKIKFYIILATELYATRKNHPMISAVLKKAVLIAEELPVHDEHGLFPRMELLAQLGLVLKRLKAHEKFLEVAPEISSEDAEQFQTFLDAQSYFFSKHQAEKEKALKNFVRLPARLSSFPVADIAPLLAFGQERFLKMLDAETLSKTLPALKKFSMKEMETFFGLINSLKLDRWPRSQFLPLFERWLSIYSQLRQKENTDILKSLFEFAKDRGEYFRVSTEVFGAIPVELSDETLNLLVSYLKGETDSMLFSEVSEIDRADKSAPAGTAVGRIENVPLAEVNALFRRNPDAVRQLKDLEGYQKLRAGSEVSASEIDRQNQQITKTIGGQDKSDHLYLRELIQNSLKAQREANIRTPIKVRSFLREGAENEWVMSVEDSAGMDLARILGPLLVLDETTNLDLTDQSRGIFGIGFYTLFADFDIVRIQTSTGDGVIHYLEIEKNSEGVIMLKRLEERKGAYRGTVMERIKKFPVGEAPLVDAIMNSDSLLRYVGAVQDTEIEFNGKKINETLRPLGTAETSLGKLSLSLTSGTRKRVALKGLYVETPKEDEYFAMVPEMYRNLLFKQNFVLDLPEKTQLTTSRKTIARKEKVLPEIQKAVAAASFQAIVTLFLKENVFPLGLTQDYFSEESFTVFPKVEDDAFRINLGAWGEVDFSRYLPRDSDNESVRQTKIARTVQLLTLIEVEFGGKKVSLDSIRLATTSKSPDSQAIEAQGSAALKNYLTKARELMEVQDNFSEFSEDEIKTKPELFAFKRLGEAVVAKFGLKDEVTIHLGDGGKEAPPAFYTTGEASISYNYTHTKNLIDNFYSLLNSETVSPKEWFDFFVKYLDLTSHESAHHYSGSHEREAHLEGVFGWYKLEMLRRMVLDKGTQRELIEEVRQSLKAEGASLGALTPAQENIVRQIKQVYTRDYVKNSLSPVDFQLLNERLEALARRQDILVDLWLLGKQSYPEVMRVLSTYLGLKPVSGIVNIPETESLIKQLAELEKKAGRQFQYVQTPQGFRIATESPLSFADPRLMKFKDLSNAGQAVVPAEALTEWIRGSNTFLEAFEKLGKLEDKPLRQYLEGVLYGFGVESALDYIRPKYDGEERKSYEAKILDALGEPLGRKILESPIMTRKTNLVRLLDEREKFAEGIPIEHVLFGGFKRAITKEDRYQTTAGAVLIFALSSLGAEFLENALEDGLFDGNSEDNVFLAGFSFLYEADQAAKEAFLDLVGEISVFGLTLEEGEKEVLKNIPGRQLMDIMVYKLSLASLDRRVLLGKDQQSFSLRDTWKDLELLKAGLPKEYLDYLGQRSGVPIRKGTVLSDRGKVSELLTREVTQRPEPEWVAGLDLQEILQTARDAGVSLPQMDKTLTEALNILPFVKEMVDTIEKEFPDHKIIVFERDGEPFYDALKMAWKGTAKEDRVISMPGSQSFWFSNGFPRSEIFRNSKELFETYGIKPGDKYLLLDTGFRGTIASVLYRILRLRYGMTQEQIEAEFPAKLMGTSNNAELFASLLKPFLLDPSGTGKKLSDYKVSDAAPELRETFGEFLASKDPDAPLLESLFPKTVPFWQGGTFANAKAQGKDFSVDELHETAYGQYSPLNEVLAMAAQNFFHYYGRANGYLIKDGKVVLKRRQEETVQDIDAAVTVNPENVNPLGALLLQYVTASYFKTLRQSGEAQAFQAAGKIVNEIRQAAGGQSIGADVKDVKPARTIQYEDWRIGDYNPVSPEVSLLRPEDFETAEREILQINQQVFYTDIYNRRIPFSNMQDSFNELIEGGYPVLVMKNDEGKIIAYTIFGIHQKNKKPWVFVTAKDPVSARDRRNVQFIFRVEAMRWALLNDRDRLFTTSTPDSLAVHARTAEKIQTLLGDKVIITDQPKRLEENGSIDQRVFTFYMTNRLRIGDLDSLITSRSEGGSLGEENIAEMAPLRTLLNLKEGTLVLTPEEIMARLADLNGGEKEAIDKGVARLIADWTDEAKRNVGEEVNGDFETALTRLRDETAKRTPKELMEWLYDPAGFTGTVGAELSPWMNASALEALVRDIYRVILFGGTETAAELKGKMSGITDAGRSVFSLEGKVLSKAVQELLENDDPAIKSLLETLGISRAGPFADFDLPEPEIYAIDVEVIEKSAERETSRKLLQDVVKKAFRVVMPYSTEKYGDVIRDYARDFPGVSLLGYREGADGKINEKKLGYREGMKAVVLLSLEASMNLRKGSGLKEEVAGRVDTQAVEAAKLDLKTLLGLMRVANVLKQLKDGGDNDLDIMDKDVINTLIQFVNALANTQAANEALAAAA